MLQIMTASLHLEMREIYKKLNNAFCLIKPLCLCENGYVESFIGKFRDELLNRKIFDNMQETKIFIAR
jgi:hypothetical protein